ncbi:hypothetical protein [Staphylospora marina]|uniref:hypothetical protein n=1 Tax=Staphylospora marina TaxID=2490858 RepID=UPI000F5BED31|nr:hypothetical protein [Staphylospora marina]
MVPETETRTHELGEILKVVDESVRMLNHVSSGEEQKLARTVSEKVEWSLDRLANRDWLELHMQLHELVYYLDLACFSLMNLNGESFHVYLQEVNQRYRTLLRKLYVMYSRTGIRQ